MRYSPKYKLPSQQLDWAQIWVNNLVEHNYWVLVLAPPYGYYVYLNLDDE